MASHPLEQLLGRHCSIVIDATEFEFNDLINFAMAAYRNKATLTLRKALALEPGYLDQLAQTGADYLVFDFTG